MRSYRRAWPPSSAPLVTTPCTLRNFRPVTAPPDGEIAALADRDGRVVVTKDRDFRDGHLLYGSPRRLLVVATGNTTNAALLQLFAANLDAVVDAFNDVDFAEIGSRALVLHRRRNPS